MNMNEEQLRARWRLDLARIATRIFDLQARLEAESRMLYASLATEVTGLQADLHRLQAEILATSGDTHVRQVAVQVEELSAQGDAVYQLLKAGMAVLLDSTDTEI